MGKTQKRKAFDNYLLERSRESNMVRKFNFTFTPYEYNPWSSKYREVKKCTTFLFQQYMKVESHIVIKL